MTRSSPTVASNTHLAPGCPLPDYSAHPFLDPRFFERNPTALRFYSRLLGTNLRSRWRYQQLLNRLLHPMGEEQPLEVNERILSSYLHDASAYVRELLLLLEPHQREPYLPLPEVEECNDMRRLAEWLFDVERPRRAFEVQRKLYLAKLLIQIDRTRMVQDGPRHQSYLREVLDKELWSYVRSTSDRVLCYEPKEGRPRLVEGACPVPPTGETWRFRVRRVVRSLPGGTYDIEVYHYDTRFKKESAGYVYVPGRREYEVDELRRYTGMERARSASILSKMLRKGINDPTAITDMLGAKFIVWEERDVHRLADLLHQVIGNPLGFRNQVDLFLRPADRAHLNEFSAEDFRVLKEDVDLLFPASEHGNGRSYLFSVELQIFTVESFLRTLHSDDYTGHLAYKRRQFLEGVLPYLFPASLYGDLIDR